MDCKSYLKASVAELNQKTDHFFKVWLKDVKNINPKFLPLVQFLIDGCKGGKKLRGTFIKLGFELTGKKFNPEILKPAVGYEIFNTAILAHDDILDLSPTRRGKPSMYMALGGNHYGISQTIVLGDIGLFMAIKLLGESNFPVELRDKAIQVLTNNVIGTALGELLDVELSTKSSVRTEKDVILIAHLKTAQYTITGPMQIGAILGGAKQELLDKLFKFGESLGIAFQVQDDILGVFGNENELGKSVTSDIEEGKNTLLIIYAVSHGDKAQKQILNKFYGKGKITEEELEKIKKVFKDTGALEYSQKLSRDLVEKGKKFIPKITDDPKYQRLLSELADFVVERDS